MPMYEYQCDRCKEVVEYIQKFSDPPMTECEACGGALSKLLSAPSFHLAGGGWYADGYADAKPKSGGSDSGATDKSAPAETAAPKAKKSADSGGAGGSQSSGGD